MTDLIITILILIASAFFVIIEFATMGARRNRLEETAETSRTSRAGLRSLNELTIMLAGAQLGITACTLILGAVTKPWVHHLLMHPLETLGLSLGIADVVAFILALFIVTFIHLVIGEMAPKSWAITHPETALQLIAVPARGFIWIFRPLLTWINTMANHMVRATGEPRSTARVRLATTRRRCATSSSTPARSAPWTMSPRTKSPASSSSSPPRRPTWRALTVPRSCRCPRMRRSPTCSVS